MDAEDETRTTEITILSDGRICLFGASREVLELLGEMDLGDPALDQRLEYLRSLDGPTRQIFSGEIAASAPEGRLS